MENPDLTMMHQNHIRDYLVDKYNIWDIPADTDIYIIKPKLGSTIIKFLCSVHHPGDNPDDDTDDESEDPYIEKLYTGTMVKNGYEFALGDDFSIEFAFSINKILEDKIKKNKFLYQALAKEGIEVLFFDNDDYEEKLNYWICA